MSKIKIQNEAHWHELRARHVGGSEIAALFHESPYQTEFGLWHVKAGNTDPVDIGEQIPVQRGQFLEQAIAKWWCHRKKFQLLEVEEYWTHDSGIGATPDNKVRDNPEEFSHQDYVAEIKTCDWRKWKENGEQPLMTWVLQLQSQLLCGGYKRGVIIVFFDMNQAPVEFWYDTDEEVQRILIDKVTAFWRSIKDGKQPDMDGEKDQELANRLRIARLGDNRPPEIDLSGNKDAVELAQRYERAHNQIKTSEAIKSESKTGLVALLDGAVKATGVEDDHFEYSIGNKKRFNFIATLKNKDK